MVRHAFEVLSFDILLDLIVGVRISFRPKLSLAYFFLVFYDNATTTRHLEWRKSHSVELRLHSDIKYPRLRHPE